jgi:hypothetical protein
VGGCGSSADTNDAASNITATLDNCKGVPKGSERRVPFHLSRAAAGSKPIESGTHLRKINGFKPRSFVVRASEMRRLEEVFLPDWE